MFCVFAGSADGRDTGRYRHRLEDGTIGHARGGARTCRAWGVDCSGCGAAPARRALLLSSCYFGEEAERRFAPPGPRAESAGKFASCAAQRKASPVICLFNRGNSPTRIRAFPGRPRIFRKTWRVCGASESSVAGSLSDRSERRRKVSGARSEHANCRRGTGGEHSDSTHLLSPVMFSRKPRFASRFGPRTGEIFFCAFAARGKLSVARGPRAGGRR